MQSSSGNQSFVIRARRAARESFDLFAHRTLAIQATGEDLDETAIAA